MALSVLTVEQKQALSKLDLSAKSAVYRAALENEVAVKTQNSEMCIRDSVPPVHNQGVSLAPLQGHALWKIFLPTTGSFFVFCITDFFSVTAPFSGRFPVTLCLLLPAIMAGPSLPTLPLKGSDRP